MTNRDLPAEAIILTVFLDERQRERADVLSGEPVCVDRTAVERTAHRLGLPVGRVREVVE